MSTTDQSPNHKRRRYQISLKWLMIVVTLFTVTVACAVGWIRYRQGQARENRARVAAVEEAVVAIEKLGGEVTSAYQKLRPQTWLEQQFDDPGDADDPVGVLKVAVVLLLVDSVTDADLVHLKGLTGLQTLFLSGTEVTDAGLVHLKGLTKLQSLGLSGNEVTDAGLVHLKGLTSLQSLVLSSTEVTDAGLEHLVGLTKLHSLSLTETNVTDAGIKKLQQALPKCMIYR